MNHRRYVRKHLTDSQFQSAEKKIPNFKVKRQFSADLNKTDRKTPIFKISQRQTYQQFEKQIKNQVNNTKTLLQIKKCIDNSEEFDDFKKKMNGLNLEELKNQLYLYTGKKKANYLAEELFKELLNNKQKACKSLLQIKGIISQKQYLAFQQQLKKFTTFDQIFNQLSNYMGRKRARGIAENLFFELRTKQKNQEQIYQSDKNKISSPKPLWIKMRETIFKEAPLQPAKNALKKVEQLINNKKKFQLFEKKLLSIIFIEDLIEQLRNYIITKEAIKLAQQIFIQLGKDKIIYKKIEKMYRALAQKGVDEKAIQNIRKLVDQGKKNDVKQMIAYLLGSTGLILYDQYSSQIEEKKIEHFSRNKQSISLKTKYKIDQYKNFKQQQKNNRSLSSKVFDIQQALTNQMRNARQKIYNAIVTRQNLINELGSTIKYEQYINNDKSFCYLIYVQEYFNQQVSYNVVRCTNCLDCNCHQNCNCKDEKDKRNCVAFNRQGYCTICPRKCHFKFHTNKYYLAKFRNVEKTRNYQTNKLVFLRSSMTMSHAIIYRLLEQIKKIIKTIIEYAKQMTDIQIELGTQRISFKHSYSTEKYFEILILDQTRNKKRGYQNRINQINQIRKQFKFYENILNFFGRFSHSKVKQFQFDTIMEKDEKKFNQKGINFLRQAIS